MYVFHKMKWIFNDHLVHIEEPTLWGFLKQPCVQPGTYRQRINRSVRKVKDLF